MKKNKIFHLVGHVLFWLITAYAFTHYSYLRPMLSPIYQELFHVFFLVIMVYLHYFLFIPYLFQRKNYTVYWSVTLIIILLLCSFELLLSYAQMENIYGKLGDDLFHHYIFSVFFLISLRDASFWMFFFILCLYQGLEKSSANKEVAILEKNKVIAVLVNDSKAISIDINELSYIQCIKNKCRLYMKNSTVYEQYASLSHWEELLAPHGAIRINRDTLIMLSAVVSFTNDNILLIPSETNVAIYKGDKKNEIFNYLCKHIPSKRTVTPDKVIEGVLSGKNGALNDEFKTDGALKFVNLEEFLAIIAGDKEKISICRMIVFLPFSNAKDIAKETQIPYRTVTRKMQYLKENNIIQHKGARKNGNYAFTPYVSKEVKTWLKTKENDLPVFEPIQTQA